MLHLILNSPFQSQALAEALSYLQPEDELVLMQDAVIAASAPSGARGWRVSGFM